MRALLLGQRAIQPYQQAEHLLLQQAPPGDIVRRVAGIEVAPPFVQNGLDGRLPGPGGQQLSQCTQPFATLLDPLATDIGKRQDLLLQ